MPFLVSHGGYPEHLFELDKDNRVGESMNEAFAGLLVSLDWKRSGILLNAPNGRLDLLPKLASEPWPFPLVKNDPLVQVPLGFRVEDDPLHG